MQLIATVSGTMVVFLNLFVFQPLLVSFILSYYMLTFVAWLLAFSPVLVFLCYTLYNAVCQHRYKNRICHEVDIVPEDRCLDVLDGSNSDSEEYLSFDFTPSASSLLSDGEQRDDQCSSTELDSVMRIFEIYGHNEAPDEDDWSMSSSETDSAKSYSSKHTDSIEGDVAAV